MPPGKETRAPLVTKKARVSGAAPPVHGTPPAVSGADDPVGFPTALEHVKTMQEARTPL